MVVRVIKSRASVHVAKSVVRTKHRKKVPVEESPVASRVPYPNPNKTVVPLPDQGVVSVIMPAYRSARYIGEAVQSALDQEMPSGWEVEVLIGVDGCPETLEAAKQVRKKQGSRVRLFAVEQNGGWPPMSNFLFRQSSGFLVAVLDSDDKALPHRFMRQHQFLSKYPEVDLVAGRGKDQHGRIVMAKLAPDPKKLIGSSTFRECAGRGGDTLYGTWCGKRRVWELVGGYDANLRLGAEGDMVMRILLHPDLYVRNLSEVVLLYRMHAQQSSRRIPWGDPKRKALWAQREARWKEGHRTGQGIRAGFVCAPATEVP